jgi:hypothetical protein
MADEQVDEQTAPVVQEFVVQGSLHLGGKLYAPGATIQLSDPELIAELRAAHAIATLFEVTPPEELQQQHEAVVSENGDLRARLAELEAQLAAQDQAAASAKSGKSSGSQG